MNSAQKIAAKRASERKTSPQRGGNRTKINRIGQIFGVWKVLNDHTRVRGKPLEHDVECIHCRYKRILRQDKLVRRPPKCPICSTFKLPEIIRESFNTETTSWPIKQRYKFKAYLSALQKRKLTWNLSTEQVKVLFDSDCHYCGVPAADSPSGNGIDRIDNTKGYEPDNCVPCCIECNRVKLNRSYERMIEHARLLIARADTPKQPSNQVSISTL